MSDPSQLPPAGLNRRVLLVVGSVVGVLVLIGVVVGVLIAVLGGSGPDGVARAYLLALDSGDYSTVCRLSTNAVQEQMLSEIQQPDAPTATCADYGVSRVNGYGFYVGQYGESRASILQDMSDQVRIIGSKTHGDRAVVRFATITTYNGENRRFIAEVLHGQRIQKASGTFDMAKELGAWKVAGLRWDG